MKSHQAKQLAGKLVRFGAVGGTSTLLFSALTWLLVSKGGMHPVLATVVAYLLLLPPNFIAHKYFTFASKGQVSTESTRFLLVHGLNIALSAGGMAIISQASLDYRWGILFSAIAVPIIVFVVMNAWVFRAAPRH
ncbi:MULTISPECIES: GtrA family protein [Stenotrophomonas]|uniref:GtrA family protein n=1 Tax=Stenotrophomonas TaxID=40323 RepID=UPI000D1ABD69|nr:MULTISPECIES: GtrA family protein [Stenotrophomonas]RRU89828.1 GtrA family protein [Stenotrophomonas maltophilia]HBP01850.1 GtrA family protein [Stenotrophomonas sp.]